ncbi:MAG: transcriptional regulator, partial [Sphingomonadales bacterium]
MAVLGARFLAGVLGLAAALRFGAALAAAGLAVAGLAAAGLQAAADVAALTAPEPAPGAAPAVKRVRQPAARKPAAAKPATAKPAAAKA